MAYLISWMYDRKNGARHSVIGELCNFFQGESVIKSIHYKTPLGKYWHKIDLKKIAWLRIKPAPEPYMPPVGK